MLTVNDIKDVKFGKSGFGGYKAEDVDNFLDEVLVSYEKLQKEVLSLTEKIKILADRVGQYREDEDSVKTALVSAQKLSTAAIADAKKEADAIIADARLRADQILNSINGDVLRQKETLAGLKKAVKDFRSNILSLYKEHLKLVNSFNAEDRLPADFNSKDNAKGAENQPVATNEPTKKNNEKVVEPPVSPTVEVAVEAQSAETPGSSKFEDLKFGEDYNVSEPVK